MESFFAEPEQISLGVHIVDARHKPTADDVTMSGWFKNSGRPFVVVANKTDKLSKTAVGENLAIIRSALELPEETPLIPFSAEKGDGPPGVAGKNNGTALKRAGWTKRPSRSCNSAAGLV